MEWLTQWNHLVFVLPLFAAVLLVFGSLLGLADLDGDGHADLDGDHGFAGKALMLFGFGRVPLAILFLVMLLLFSLVGLSSEALLDFLPGHGFISVGVAFLAMLFGTPVVARAVAKLVPTSESYNVSNTDMIGNLAEALFDAENEVSYAQTRDHEGNLHQITIKIEGRVRKGERVALTDYDTSNNTFTGVVATSGQE